MDLLKVLIPEEYRNSVITSINIEDTTFQELNNYNPGIHILAVSVEIQDLTPGNWEYQVEQIPHSESSIEWELKTGELFILTGGSFSYKGYSCGGNASQICILVIKGTKSSTIRIDNLVPLNNWIAITKSLLPDEAVSSVQDEFWLSPNCGSGCTTAQVAIFSDDIQEKSYTINKP